MRKILIPTDFSENAINAIKYGLESFKYEKSKVYFLHTYADEVYSALNERENIAEVLENTKKLCEQSFETTSSFVKQRFSNPQHEYHYLTAFNSLIDEIDTIVDRENIDIIIMGTKGETNDTSLTFGSNAMQVLRYVKCPVMLVPKDYEYSQPRQLVFPTNYMTKYNRRELKLLSEFAHQCRADVDFLHISTNKKLSFRQEDNLLFIKDTLQKNKLNFLRLDETNIAKGLNTYLSKHKIDMLVMVNTRHSFLENIIFKTTIDKVGLNLQIPFLALQNINRVQL